MSRKFVRASSQYLTGGTTLTAAPMTVSAWVKPDVNQTQLAVCFGDTSVNNEYFRLYVKSLNVRWVVRNVGSGTLGGFTTSSDDLTVGKWSHIAGVEHSTSSRYSWLNGVKGTENTVTVVPINIVQTRIGTVNRLENEMMDGSISDVAIWNVGLRDDELFALSRGVSPLLIRPANLYFYMPLHKKEDFDVVANFPMTATNSPTIDVPPGGVIHPWWFYPGRTEIVNLFNLPRRRVFNVPASGAQTVNPPTLVVEASVPTPSVTPGGLTVSPATLTVETSVPTPTVSGDNAIAPPVLVVEASVPTPAVTFGNRTVSPATLVVETSVPTLTITPGGLTASPTTLVVEASVPTPTVTLGGGAQTVNPPVLVVEASVPAPTVTPQGKTVSPATLVVETSVPTPVVSGDNTVSPATLIIEASVPTPAVTFGNRTVSPATLVVEASVPTPTVTLGGGTPQTVTPGTILIEVSVPIVSVTPGGIIVNPASLSIEASVPDPVVSLAGHFHIRHFHPLHFHSLHWFGGVGPVLDRPLFIARGTVQVDLSALYVDTMAFEYAPVDDMAFDLVADDSIAFTEKL